MAPKNYDSPLVIDDLEVSIKEKKVVRGVSLTIEPGTVHALMGPNGTGKSSLALALMGHPSYDDVEGSARLGGIELLDLLPEDRARAGLFLAMQSPAEVPGVPMTDFLRSARAGLGGGKSSRIAFMKKVERAMEEVGLDAEFLGRYVNEGFSGGEKKRSEIVQARVLEPRIALLDEIDSGLDIDALRDVARAICAMRDAGTGFLVVTHYRRILDHVAPDFVHVMAEGRIVRSAPGLTLAEELEAGGYDAVVGAEVPSR